MRNKPLYFFKIILLLITISSAIPFLDQAKADDLIFLVENIYPQETGSNPANFTAFNDALFFTAETAGRGVELWRSDATASGTQPVKDIYRGSNSSNPAQLTRVDDVLFFVAADARHGTELWRSDGTETGTTLVKDINAQGLGDASYPTNLTAVADALFFAADDGKTGIELWKSDGTAAGTIQVKDINATGSANPAQLTVVRETLFFIADDGETGIELWKSDGTAAGTVPVKDINTTGSADPAQLTVVQETLFFIANDGETGIELWKSDGTAAGTVSVKDIYPGETRSRPENLTAVKGTLFFTANDGVHGFELWRSDGTETGTTLVKDINADGGSSSGPADLINVNGLLFFQANDGKHGRELWTSDGTAAGTTLLKDINSTSSSTPAHLTDVKGTLFFTANDGRTGVEVWRSDGTAAGTFQIRDIYAGRFGSTPAHLTAVNDILFFRANDGLNGAELWAMAQPALTLTATTDTDTAEVGQTIVYTYWITNSGNIHLDHINANDARQGLITLAQSGLAPGTGLKKSFSYEVTDVDLPGPLTNKITVTSAPAADLQLSATATTTVRLITRPDIAVAMTANVATAKVDQIIDYTYYLTNTGLIDLVDLEARDSRLGQIPLARTTLAPGEEITKTLSYKIRRVDLPGPVTNTVAVTGRSILGVNVSNTASELVTLDQESPLPRITKLYLPAVRKSIIEPNIKKGVGIVSYTPACADIAALNAHWYLNWTYFRDPSCGPEDAEKFVPRIYNADSMQHLPEAIEYAKASGWLMGFSEPNLPWQGNVSPAQGAELWKQIEEAADSAGIKLVSPSPNQWEPDRDGLPYGHQWLWTMVDEYQTRYGKKPRFDAIAWNIYRPTPDETIAYLTARRNEMVARGYDVPIWILEYGGKCWNSSGETGNEAIMINVTTWFETTPWIGRYAWFANRLSGSQPGATNYQSCSLIDFSTGQLTPLGEIYAEY